MAAAPVYAATPLIGIAAISAANTNRDGTTGTYVTIVTAGASGALIESLSIVATGTTTAGVVRIFANSKLLLEQLIAAITPSATIAVASFYFSRATHPHIFPIRLDVSEVLKASTHNAEGFNVRAAGGSI